MRFFLHICKFFYNFAPQINIHRENITYMKRKILLLPLLFLMTMTVRAEVNGLRVELLSGGEQTAALAQIGKIVFGEDSVLLFDQSGAQIGSTPLSQFGKIVFYDDGSHAISDVKASSLQVFYDATQESLLVRGMDGNQTIRVYSASGQLLQLTNATQGEAVLHIGGLKDGAYLLQAGAQVVKFIKE